MGRIVIKRELDQLNDLAARIQTLIQDHQVSPADSWFERVCKTLTRRSRHKELEKQLQVTDGDVSRVLDAISGKRAVVGLEHPDVATSLDNKRVRTARKIEIFSLW